MGVLPRARLALGLVKGLPDRLDIVVDNRGAGMPSMIKFLVFGKGSYWVVIFQVDGDNWLGTGGFIRSPKRCSAGTS